MKKLLRKHQSRKDNIHEEIYTISLLCSYQKVLPFCNFSRRYCWSNQFQFKIHILTDLPQWRCQKIVWGSKIGPLTDWIRYLLGGPILSPLEYLLQLYYSNIKIYQKYINIPQTITELVIRTSNKGGPW
jgi:hypothetical protein